MKTSSAFLLIFSVALVTTGFSYWQFSIARQATQQLEQATLHLEEAKSIKKMQVERMAEQIELDKKAYGLRKRDSTYYLGAKQVQLTAQQFSDQLASLAVKVRRVQLSSSAQSRHYDFWKVKACLSKSDTQSLYHTYERTLLVFNRNARTEDRSIILSREEFEATWLSKQNTTQLIHSLLALEATIISKSLRSLEPASDRLAGCLSTFPRIKKIYFTYW